GKGIVHDEGPTEEIFQHGGRSHGVQLWLNMPGEHKHDDPDYRHLRVSDIPAITGAGVQISLIAGTHAGEIGPLETHSDPLLLAARLDAGAAYTFDLRPDHHHGVYLMTGAASLRAGEPAVQEGELALVASATASLTVTGGETGAHLIVFGGPPIEDTLVRYGPFVANSQAHMHDIIRAYQAGRFGAIPQD
ncbi:MAG: pirin-like C-terminal cupin domain-containing protein, partial [Pseudomonadota bacterium]